MRTEFLRVATRPAAKKLAPWAAKLVKVCGGYQAFESVVDYKNWQNQK